MTPDQQTPIKAPYRSFYIDALEPPRLVGGVYEMYASELDLEPIMAEANFAWSEVAPILKEHEIARLEFIWDDSRQRRGVVLFDTNQRAVVHIANALLGYAGGGPSLSARIMTALGLTEHDIQLINKLVWQQQGYVIVVTREATVMPRHVLYASGKVLGRWSYWRN